MVLELCLVSVFVSSGSSRRRRRSSSSSIIVVVVVVKRFRSGCCRGKLSNRLSEVLTMVQVKHRILIEEDGWPTKLASYPRCSE